MAALTKTHQLLRVHNVAKRCGVSPRTVRSWVESGLLPAHKRGPKVWFVYEDDLLRFLERDQLHGGCKNSPYYADLAPIRLVAADGQELSGLLCTWSSIAVGPGLVRTPASLVLGCAPVIAESSTTADHSVYTISFFAVCKVICDSLSSEDRRAVVHFCIERSSPARPGVENGYHCLWNKYGMTLSFIPGNLTLSSSGVVSSYLVQSFTQVLPGLMNQIRSWDSPSHLSGAVCGIPLRGYVTGGKRSPALGLLMPEQAI